MDPEVRLLFEAATRPYRRAGRYTWHFARGKLRHDPVFFSLLRRGRLPDRGKLIDIGCGQGILLSLLKAARKCHRAGTWPSDWPPPPLNLEMEGIEVREERVRVAREALGAGVEVIRGDVREVPFAPCAVIVILDVLLYLGEREQRRVLDRAAALRLYTEGSSWFSGDEGKKGRLAAGQLADLAVLSADYFTVPEEEIRGIEAVLTVMGGKIVHGSGDFAPLAPPLPPVSPDWSPGARYGGYHRGSIVAGLHPQGCACHSHRPARSPKESRFWGLGCDCFAF